MMARAENPPLDLTDPADTALAAVLGAPCTGLIGEGIRYWRRIRPGAGLLPGRQHFDPIEIPRVMPYVGLFDVVREPRLRIRVRMAGSKLVDTYGTGKVGRFVDEFLPDFDDSLTGKDYGRVADSGIPVWYRGAQSTALGKPFLSVERIYLPLAVDGRTVDIIFGVYLFSYSDGREH